MSTMTRLVLMGWLILAAVYTRYDGWLLGAAVWCVITWQLSRKRELWGKVSAGFLIFTLLAVAGPVSWLWYNHHFMHDALDFMRGPYSAAAIEKRTSPPGSQATTGDGTVRAGRCCTIRGRRRWMPQCGRRALR